MKKAYFSIVLAAGLTIFAGCGSDSDPVATVDPTLNEQVITGFSTNVASAEYTGLAAKTDSLWILSKNLAESKTEANLTAVRNKWREARKIWEQSEAQLFGPVATEDIDPSIDTWPVDFNAINNQLAGEQEFTADYISGLDDALKGFHPIEYIIFGNGGTKAAANITTRELQYLVALTLNVKTRTATLQDHWTTGSTTNYFATFSTAGNGSAEYATQEAALEQLVAAMADICGEVGESKIGEPYNAQDPGLEESPYSKNSLTDFTNNITGIQNVYLGKYKTDGAGLEDIVKKYNLSLDSEIKGKLSAAINSLNIINNTTTFGDAIIHNKPLVENAITAINDLKTTLEDELLPFVKLHAN